MINMELRKGNSEQKGMRDGNQAKEGGDFL
jgi:hypothetical protein